MTDAGPESRPIDKLLRPLHAFAQHKLAGAGLLVAATVAALVWANSPWAHAYHHILELNVGLTIGDVKLDKTLHHWINDGLMGVFFFVVGLEIKRELLVGELSTLRKATLPAIAALGGMVLPALLYFAVNHEGPAAAGWGIPMATDIAFALGALALLGDRVPLGLRVFLTALAIVDDIGAVVVIALFYTTELSLAWLGFGLACIAVSIVLNALDVRHALAYLVVGFFAWLGFLESGVHATIAAILMAFTIPARTRIDGPALVTRLNMLIARLEEIGPPSGTDMNDNRQQHCLERMVETIEHASAPLQEIEHALAGPVTFTVLPVFALANAGVSIDGSLLDAVAHPIAVGIALGLVAGKTAGVSAASYLAVRLGLADLPENVSWKEIIGVALLAGIGFTMALFIASLAFSDVAAVETAKVGILLASTLAAVTGWLFLRAVTRA